MKFTDEDISYITGEKFSDYYHLRLYGNQPISRRDCILKHTMGKKVLHIGCCDHLPVIAKKIETKTWLHGLLLDNCSFVAGIDINLNAIEYIRTSYNIDNVFCVDITDSMPEELQSTIFDFAVLGDVVEHVNNPVEFLLNIKKNIKKNVRKIIITVPNALRFYGKSSNIQNIMNMFRGFSKEMINSDHRYWFTPYTIAKVCFEAGLYPEELLFCDNEVKLRYIIAKKLRIIKYDINIDDVTKKYSSSRWSFSSQDLLLICSLDR